MFLLQTELEQDEAERGILQQSSEFLVDTYLPTDTSVDHKTGGANKIEFPDVSVSIFLLKVSRKKEMRCKDHNRHNGIGQQ